MSIRISSKGVDILDRARKRKGWGRQSSDWLAAAKDVSLTQLKDVWAKRPVRRKVLQDICNCVGVDWREVVDYETSSPEDLAPIKFCKGKPHVSTFYGRTEDLKNFQDWIVNKKCRVLAINGMGGIGKSAVAVKLTKEISPYFDYMIWYSLASSPLLEEFLTDIFQFLGRNSDFDFPKNISNINERISQLIKFLNRDRCLLILDGLETLLLSGKYAGYYQDKHLNYGDLMRRVGEEHHKSCLLVTSREITNEIALLADKDSWCVRACNLQKLGEEARGIFQEHGLLDEHRWKKLSESYRGNPLFLKIISSYIADMFGGSVDIFLRQGTLMTGNIETCFDELLRHLSDVEHKILRILAENDEIISCDQLREILGISPIDLARAHESLIRRRSLVEITTSSSQSPDGLTLAPVIKEYLLKRIRVTSETR